MPKISYGAATEEIIDLFGDYFTGSSSFPFLVICSDELGEAASNALTKSLESLGYKAPAYSLIMIASSNAPALLDAAALRLLIEGVDPYRIICADEQALLVLSEAYNTTFVPDAVNRIQGRSSGIFANLNEMVQDPQEKYVAWEILKALK